MPPFFLRGLDVYNRAHNNRACDVTMSKHPFPRLSADDDDPENGAAILVRPKEKTQKPPMYKVLLLNDDYTPMEFVVHILERFFGMGLEAAQSVMLTVHMKGLAVVGVFSHEIAETKVMQVMDYARQNQHPLQCTMEKE